MKLGSDHSARDEHDKARLAMCNAAIAAIDKRRPRAHPRSSPTGCAPT